jgi:hypothetical protein
VEEPGNSTHFQMNFPNLSLTIPWMTQPHQLIIMRIINTFQLPSKIIQKAKNLKISLHADKPSEGSNESSEFDANKMVAHQHEDISMHTSCVALPPHNKIMHTTDPNSLGPRMNP